MSFLKYILVMNTSRKNILSKIPTDGTAQIECHGWIFFMAKYRDTCFWPLKAKTISSDNSLLLYRSSIPISRRGAVAVAFSNSNQFVATCYRSTVFYSLLSNIILRIRKLLS